MKFRVGPFLYAIRPVSGYIEHEGDPCLGLCDNETHELFISDQASDAQQIQVVCHEYMEAWLYHFGQDVHDKETYCDLFGLAMTQFVMDLMADLREAAKNGTLEQMIFGDQVPRPPADLRRAPNRDGRGAKREASRARDARRAHRLSVRAVRVTDSIVNDDVGIEGRDGSGVRYRLRLIEPIMEPDGESGGGSGGSTLPTD